MPLKFEKNTEAFLAVLAVVVGADNAGSLEERDFLFSKVKGIPVFGNPSSQDFNKLLGQVTDAIYAQLPLDDGAISPAGIDTLLGEAKNALSPELRKTLVATAAELVDADGAEASEKALLDKIRRVLG
ncbi:MAG TPA: tellurite resistance TerB family protein [Steroidobacteraceae bacterium]|nr:tellurite resistance TerB family protein [Steroidobacteraceae bacterium]